MSKKPESASIGASVVSFGVLAAGLGIVLFLALVAVGQGLGFRIEKMQDTVVPAEHAVALTHDAMSRLFHRQSRVLATRTGAELDEYRDHSALEKQLRQSTATLNEALTKLSDQESRDQLTLTSDLETLLLQDSALFESVEHRHGFQETAATVSTRVQATLQSMIQDARAVSGAAHLEYVLGLRSLSLQPSTFEVRKLVYGGQRVQQEAAGQFVALAFQLGQLGGKIALAPTNDDLNSIAANEVAQNLDRSRTQLRTLLTVLDKDAPIFGAPLRCRRPSSAWPQMWPTQKTQRAS